ncbi:Fur family transcriptional regulator, iron response regulator [Pontibaca methylaminivorans]|uniref:Ferric uptake regulation protein n=2 Tax=Pontibaca methylaminivorans TaxID=515897 RepID=A0A1R3X0I4_9RHOB|nr:Fur family transcriptional regulator, iron response regulator [Pontibaca methylaminivorans]
MSRSANEFHLKPLHKAHYMNNMAEIEIPKGNSPTETAARWLGKGDLRPTRQRVALAELLIGDGRHRHVTAESLYEAAREGGVSVSLATVYNTLRAFCEVGLMQEVTVNGTRSYFDTNTHEHPHFYWEDDGVLSDAPAERLHIIGLPPAPEGAEVASVDVVIRLRRR